VTWDVDKVAVVVAVPVAVAVVGRVAWVVPRRPGQLRSQSASPGRTALLSDDLPQVWHQDDPRVEISPWSSETCFAPASHSAQNKFCYSAKRPRFQVGQAQRASPSPKEV
jgi:hypothetical protein